jgi:glycosyltransferase involved in cell wall biosynthesis
MDLSIFASITVAIAVINISYYFYFLKFAAAPYQSETADKSPTEKSASQQPVSLIVCAKNEAGNLQNLLPQLLRQEYTDYEIILVNDSSSDDTLEVMESFKEQDSRIKIVNVVPNESFWGNKKYALTLGIKKAVNDKLLFIDADCQPESDHWIAIMSSLYGVDTSIVLGYGGYKKEKGILNGLIRYETAIAAMQYFAYAMHGNAYMGVGRNLGYTATQFYESRGFMSHMKILGGDDDLFINEASNKNNTSVALDQSSFTYSQPKKKWYDWWTQKRRHINTASHYKLKHKLSLGLFFSSQVLFVISVIFGLIFMNNWMLFLGVLLVRYLITWLVVGSSFARLKEKDLIVLYPFFELLLMASQLGLFFNNLSKKPVHWN